MNESSKIFSEAQHYLSSRGFVNFLSRVYGYMEERMTEKDIEIIEKMYRDIKEIKL